VRTPGGDRHPGAHLSEMVQVEARWVAAQIVDGPQLTGAALGRYFTVDPHQGLFT